MIPTDLRSALEASVGLIRSITPVSGGDINEAARVETPDARYFVKWNFHPRSTHVPSGSTRLELAGHGERTPHSARDRRDRSTRRAGAGMDRSGIEQGQPPPKHWGAASPNNIDRARKRTASITTTTIGSTPQHNTPARSWIEFYRDQRLGAQRDLAQQQRLSHIRSGAAARSGDGAPRAVDR